MGEILRPATADDARKIFDWRNDPWIANLSATGPIESWDDHTRWFREALCSDRHLLFVIRTDEGIEVGTVRLDKADESKGNITIYMLRDYTGHGLGVRVLKEACQNAFTEWTWLQSIHALIRQERQEHIAHDGSRKAFSKAGFVLVPSRAASSHEYIEMALVRS